LGIACGNDANPYRPNPGFSNIQFIQYAANSSYNSLQVAVTRSIAPLTLGIAYTYSHSIDDSSDRFDHSLVNSYNIPLGRASSNFDQRHLLNMSYVYDLPFFRSSTGWTKTFIGGWALSSIISIHTGTPFSVLDTAFADNAGVSNGVAPTTNGGSAGVFADLVPGTSPKSTPSAACAVTGTGPQLYNPCAYAAPQGLTFGNSGRNSLRDPRTTNFDASLLKHFKIKEATALEFRAEAFNLFNHTQWSGVYDDINSPSFLHPDGAHRARTLQLGLKFLF